MGNIQTQFVLFVEINRRYRYIVSAVGVALWEFPISTCSQLTYSWKASATIDSAGPTGRFILNFVVFPRSNRVTKFEFIPAQINRS